MAIAVAVSVMILVIVSLMLLIGLGRGLHGMAVALILAVAAGVVTLFFLGDAPSILADVSSAFLTQLPSPSAERLRTATGLINLEGAPQQFHAAANGSADDKRPAWLAMHGQLIGKEYQIAVPSGLYVTLGECRRALVAAEQQAVGEYLDHYLDDGAAELVSVDASYLREHVQREEYAETVQASIGTMQQLHGLLVFDDDARSEFHDRWRQALIARRLWYVGGGGGLVLAAMASAFSYLLASGRTAVREPVLR